MPVTRATKKTNRVRTRSSKSGLWIRKSVLAGRGKWFIVAAFALIGASFVYFSQAATPSWWKPTNDKPLKLSWILSDPINLSNAKDLGTTTKSGLTAQPEADVFDLDANYTSASTVAALHAKGKKVICYFDAGVWESYRDDAGKFPGSDKTTYGRKAGDVKAYTGDPKYADVNIIGSVDIGWDGSYWLDIRRTDILEPLMRSRIQECKDKGFDAVEPDEITNWSNANGFGLTYQDQLRYNIAFAGWAHDMGMSVGLKGNLEQAHDLWPYFDWALIEECIQYKECYKVTNAPDPEQVSGLAGADGKEYDGVQYFTKNNKPVWVAEYKAISSANCDVATTNRVNAALYDLNLRSGQGSNPCPPFATINNPPTTTNKPPTVTLTSAVASATAPASFTVTATGVDPDGSVAKVEISQDGTVVKTCTAATCVHQVTSLPARTNPYAFSARVYDNASPAANGLSNAVNVSVTGAPVGTGGGPSAITGIGSVSTASWTGDQLTLNWTKSVSQNIPVTYEVKVGSALLIKTTQNSYTIKTFNGQKLAVSVKAIDATGATTPTYGPVTVTPICFMFWCWQ